MRRTPLPSNPGSPSHEIHLEIQTQPDDRTCGPTCLHAIYHYYGISVGLGELVEEVEQLEEGGTVAVTLGNHALASGFDATIYTYNLQLFDPTWFESSEIKLMEKLTQQARVKSGRKLKKIISEYLDFLGSGGVVRFEDLTDSLLERILSKGTPILTGLSATYLYNCAREINDDYDDVRGEPAGHFVILCNYLQMHQKVRIADPLHPNPIFSAQFYDMDVNRVISSILLGTLTYDANLLVITPREIR